MFANVLQLVAVAKLLTKNTKNMDAKEFLIKNKVDTTYVETFCNKNGWGKINLEDLLNNFIKDQALQLKQTDVSGSDLHDKIIKQIPDAYKEQISKTIKKHYR